MALTAAECQAAKPRDRQFVLVDGDGLELLVTPAGRKIWRFRYRFKGERDRLTLGQFPTLGLAAARVAATKCRAQIYAGIDPGAPVKRAELPLAEIVDRYIADHAAEWKPSSLRTYRSQLGFFSAWAASAKVRRVEQIDPAALSDFRSHTIKRPRADGSTARRSAYAINGDLRTVHTMLQVLRKAGRLPSIPGSDAIADNLGLLPVPHVRPDPLRSADLRELVAACSRYDAEHAKPIGPLVLAMLLGGFRLGEALRLAWSHVRLAEQTILVVAGKTGAERSVDLAVSPALARLLGEMIGTGRVFSFTLDQAMDERRRLVSDYGAPPFLWSKRHSKPNERSAPTLRSTCASYLVCAPSIYRGASTAMAALQLGHSEEVLRTSYLGALRRIPATATTLEDAMGIADLLDFGGRRRLRLVDSE
jgi:integrase